MKLTNCIYESTNPLVGSRPIHIDYAISSFLYPQYRKMIRSSFENTDLLEINQDMKLTSKISNLLFLYNCNSYCQTVNSSIPLHRSRYC